LVLFRSATGLAAMCAWFYGVGYLPLADALLLNRLQPVLVALLAPMVLAERTSRAAALAIGVSLVGVVLILQPSMEVGNLAGLVLLASAFLGAAAHLALRRLTGDDDPTVIVLAFMVIGTVVTAPLAVAGGVWPRWEELPAIISLSGLATLGQVVMTYAYRVERAPQVAAASYVGVPLSVLWGWMIWGEIPTGLVWAGGILVVAAGMFLLVNRRGTTQRRFGR
jgi:drug/metabolite transporter (DMT)-like permease